MRQSGGTRQCHRFRLFILTMKQGRNFPEQTRTIDEQKQDRTLLVEGKPEGIRDGNFLFDGEIFYIRSQGNWVAIGKVDPPDAAAIQEQIDDNIPFSTQL